MTVPRSQLVNLDTTRYYHCVTRCVRRGFLCGYDTHTKKDYEYRREWIEKRLFLVASVYCISICSHAIMHNHYHLLVYVDKEKGLKLTDHDVINRWEKLHRLPSLIKRMKKGELSSKTELRAAQAIIAKWRKHLYDLSWLMKEINQYIARHANKEDDCKGHFWESRFTSQALLDDQAVLATMTYIDLNPIRAGIANTPEESKHTSIRHRITTLQEKKPSLPCFHPFESEVTCDKKACIPFNLTDYIELVDWSGRQMKLGKKGKISATLPPILARLNITSTQWANITTHLERPRAIMIGTKKRIDAVNQAKGRVRSSGLSLPE